jgi:hypothetical protein
MSCSDTIITMGGRKGRKVSKLLSLHVENEGPVRSLRYRRPRVTPISPPRQSATSGDSNWSQAETPVYLSNDSGYLGDSTPSPPGSEPDWFFRPGKPGGKHDRRFQAKYEGLETGKSWSAKIQELFGFGRPNYVDYHSPQWFLRTEAILCAIIVVTVLACLGFCLMISVKLFNNTDLELNGKYKSIQFAAEKQAIQDDLSLPGVEKKADVTKETVPIEHVPREQELPAIQNNPSSEKAKAAEIEVIDLMKEEVKKPVDDQKTPEIGTVLTESQMLSDKKIEAEKPKKLPAEKVKKTKNQNPLTVAVAKPAKMSKVKVRSPSSRKMSAPQSLDYPDDPKFRGMTEEFLDYPDSSL